MKNFTSPVCLRVCLSIHPHFSSRKSASNASKLIHVSQVYYNLCMYIFTLKMLCMRLSVRLQGHAKIYWYFTDYSQIRFEHSYSVLNAIYIRYWVAQKHVLNNCINSINVSFIGSHEWLRYFKLWLEFIGRVYF